MKKINSIGNMIIGLMLCILGFLVIYDSITIGINTNYYSILEFIGGLVIMSGSVCLFSARYSYSENILFIQLLVINREIYFNEISKITNTSFGLYRFYVNKKYQTVVLYFGRKDMLMLISVITNKNPDCITVL